MKRSIAAAAFRKTWFRVERLAVTVAYYTLSRHDVRLEPTREKPMSEQQPNGAGREDSYGSQLNRASRGQDKPPVEVLNAECIRAYRIARKGGLLHQDAEDVSQEYCLKIVRFWGKWDQDRPLLPFLNKTLANEITTHHRRRETATLHGTLLFGEFSEPNESAFHVHSEPPTFDAGKGGDIALRREYLSYIKCPTN